MNQHHLADVLGQIAICHIWQMAWKIGFPAGLFRPGKSQKGPGTGRDRTVPRDPEGPVVLWSREKKSSKVPGLFLKVPGLPGSFSLTGFY